MNWIEATTKPTGDERKMLLWIEWPDTFWPEPPELVIGWWKHGPQTFAFREYENANHLVTHWCEITKPAQ